MIPPAHLWPSEGDRQQALRNGDRLSLPRLLLLDRGDVLHWHLPGNYALPDAITWREQRPDAFSRPARQRNRRLPRLTPGGTWRPRWLPMASVGLACA